CATSPREAGQSHMARCLEAATRAPLAPPLPACGERSDSERSEGIRVRGRSRESELVDKPPHPICFASQGSARKSTPDQVRGRLSPRTRGEVAQVALPRSSRYQLKCDSPDLEKGRRGQPSAAVLGAKNADAKHRPWRVGAPRGENRTRQP